MATKAHKVQQLIQQAEGAYRSGVDNYRGGRLEAARSDFDMAVDLMLTSGMDVKNDAQLSDEFEHLLNAINSLEMSALKQGTGFSAPIEAAPLDAADEVTFPPDAALTAKVQEELKTTQSDFPLVVNDYVAGFINYFTNSPTGHAHLIRSLERAGKYKEMISKDLSEEGVPQDLIYLAVAESGFQPQALNAHTGAGGMWQFMPFAGSYGLTRNGWLDERFDPEKSSIAYAKYMKSLYDQFGDWYLAMAAYDWGPGNIQRSVMRTGYADFWELYRRNELPTGDEELCARHHRGDHHGEEPSAVRAGRHGARCAGCLGHGDGGLLGRSAAGGGCDRRLAAGDRRFEPKPSAHEYAGRYGLRPASSRGNAGCLSEAHCRRFPRRSGAVGAFMLCSPASRWTALRAAFMGGPRRLPRPMAWMQTRRSRRAMNWRSRWRLSPWRCVRCTTSRARATRW